MTDFLTVLVCGPGKRAAKRYTDPQQPPDDYDAGGLFTPIPPIPVSGMADLIGALEQLRRWPNAFAIRGRLKADAPSGPIPRRKHDRPGEPATFEDFAHLWAALDVDESETLFDPFDLRGSVERWRATLSPALRDAEIVFHFSAKAHLSTTVRGRAWIWFDRPVGEAEGQAWARSHGFDPATFRTVQPIYSSDPVFEGCADPLDRSLVHLPGGVVHFDLDAEALAKIQADRTKERIERAEGEHNGLFYELLEARGDILRQLEHGKWIVTCPDEHEHSSPGGSGTVLWAPREGQKLGVLHCTHTSAGHDTRTAADWLERFAFEERAAAESRLPEAASPELVQGLTESARLSSSPSPFTQVPVAPHALAEPDDMIARLRRLQNQGPAHPTGIPPLDKALRGGMREEKIMIVGGAPGAGKTALLRQIADYMCRTGVAVGWLAADEEPSAIDGRRLQAIGVPRVTAEQPDDATLELAARTLSPLPFVVYDSSEGWTVERVFADLANRYPNAPRAIFADSVQTIRTERTTTIESERKQIDDVLMTAKALARTPATRAMVAFSSELGRGSYRSEVAAEATSDLAAFKESGGIEYYGHILLVLRSVKGEGAYVDASMPKNRLGPKVDFLLRMDFETTNLVESFDNPKDASRKARAEAIIPDVHKALESAGWPGLSGRAIKSQVPRDEHAVGDALKLMLERGIVTVKDGQRGAMLWSLVAGAPAQPVSVSYAPPPLARVESVDESLAEMAAGLAPPVVPALPPEVMT